MTHDPLSDVLRSVRLRGAVFFYVSCQAPWAAEAPTADRVMSEVMPGADHLIAYHLVVKGEAWAQVEGGPAVRLARGDIAMFPRGHAHVMSSAPGVRGQANDGSWVATIRDVPKPVPVTYRGGITEPGIELPEQEAGAIVICGFIGCDLRPFNPLIEAMPALLHIPAQALGEWVAPVLHQAARESLLRQAGSTAALERLSEMVFVDAARRYLDAMPESASGWLAALRDRHIGRAIGLLHERLSEDWTLDELGRHVGLSRSALHERFAALVGLPPMQYLTQWRMQRGAQLLREGRATVAVIAQEVGYDSEAAFARAFKRATGLPPAAWRRAQVSVA